MTDKPDALREQSVPVEKVKALIKKLRNYEGWTHDEAFNQGEECGSQTAADELEALLPKRRGQ